MPGFRITPNEHARIVVTLLAGLCFSSGSSTAQTQTNGKALVTGQTQIQFKIESNLVVVRVVVRDAHGHPVEGLKKEDFKLFDRGKEQSIAQFEEESSVEAPSISAIAPVQGQTAVPPPAAPLERFIALYFDDVDTSDGDMMQARDAADHYLAANLAPNDRVGIFTTEKILSSFTSAPKQIREALSLLHASSRIQARIHECPDLSDYQAQELTQNNDPDSDVWMVALAEARKCAPPPDPRSTAVAIRMLAERITNQAEALARANLEQLAQVVKYVSQAPGLRTVILVSPGFLSQSEQLALDRTIDRALRSQVVINSLNPKGLAVLMRESDVSRSSIVLSDPRATQARHNLDAARELVAGDVLAELAQGTGGEFVHDNNDLKAGFEALAGHPAHYILSFAPRDLKLDGKFHELKVTLAEKQKGYTIQARRGYFALKDEIESASNGPPPETRAGVSSESAQPKSQANMPVEVKQPRNSDSAALEQEQIDSALRSKTDSAELPVGLEASPSEGQGETRILALTVHLDTRPLPLRKEGGHNLDTLTFAVAVFDRQDNVVQVKQRRAKVDLLDDQLPDFVRDGVDVNTMFELKPGTYRLRAVVIESGEHRLGTLSREVNIP